MYKAHQPQATHGPASGTRGAHRKRREKVNFNTSPSVPTLTKACGQGGMHGDDSQSVIGRSRENILRLEEENPYIDNPLESPFSSGRGFALPWRGMTEALGFSVLVSRCVQWGRIAGSHAVTYFSVVHLGKRCPTAETRFTIERNRWGNTAARSAGKTSLAVRGGLQVARCRVATDHACGVVWSRP